MPRKHDAGSNITLNWANQQRTENKQEAVWRRQLEASEWTFEEDQGGKSHIRHIIAQYYDTQYPTGKRGRMESKPCLFIPREVRIVPF